MSVISEPVARSRAIATVAEAERPRWAALLLISLAQLMVVLDTTIVSIALPSAQEALRSAAEPLVARALPPWRAGRSPG